MKYKILIWIIGMFILSSFVFAVPTKPTAIPLFYWNGDSTGVEYNGESGNLTKSGNGGVETPSLNIDFGNARYNFSAGNYLSNSSLYWGDYGNGHTFCYWLYNPVWDTGEVGWVDVQDGTDTLYLRFYDAGGLKSRMKTAGGDRDIMFGSSPTGWNHLCHRCNGTHCAVFINGTQTGILAIGEDLDNVLDTSSEIGIGNSPPTSTDDAIDEVILFNESLSLEEIEWLVANPYKSTKEGGTINISNVLPIDNSQFNTDTISINFTYNASASLVNFTLYINGTINQTKNNNPSGYDIFTEFNITLPEGDYTFYINGTDNTTSKVTGIHTFYIDTTAPVISTDFINGSVFYKNLTGQFNFSDNIILSSYNITLDGTTDISSNYSIGIDSLNITLSYDISNLSAGLHTMTVILRDGHTAGELRGNYSWTNGLFNDYLRYDFYDKGYIKSQLKDKSLLDKWQTKRFKDKYTQILEPANPRSKIVIIEKSDLPIYIYERQGYYGGKWINVGNHWKDYVLKNEPNAKIDIKRIDLFSVEVTITGIKNIKKLEFSSIGDLNIVETNYSFYNINLTTTYIDLIFETVDQTITFNLTKPDNSYSTIAEFKYDNTTYSLNKFVYDYNDYYTVDLTTPFITDTTTKNFTFYFNITNGTSSYYYNETYNQSIYPINIDNCSTGNWSKALTFVLKDELTDLNVTGDLDIDLDVWYESETKFRDFSFGFEGNHEYSICIYPNESSYRVNSLMQYTNQNSSNRKYFLTDYLLDNTTDIIYLYLINKSLPTNVKLKVYDSSTGEPIKNAYIKILRYYPEGNGSGTGGIYKQVEVERTDESGETMASLILYDVFYSFIVEIDNEIKLQTAVSKLITTLKVLPVSLFDDVLDSATRIKNVDVDVSCDKDTLICRVIWNDRDNLVQTILFEVYRTNMFGKKLIHSQEASSASGSMVYTITEDVTGNTYKAVAHIHTNTAYSWYGNVAQYIISFKDDLRKWGGVNALFPIMLLGISIMFALMTHVGAIGVILGSILMIIGSTLIGILELSFTNVLILIVLGGILIAKIKQ